MDNEKKKALKEQYKKAASPHACGAAFDYAIAVSAGQIGGRYNLFI